MWLLAFLATALALPVEIRTTTDHWETFSVCDIEDGICITPRGASEYQVIAHTPDVVFDPPHMFGTLPNTIWVDGMQITFEETKALGPFLTTNGCNLRGDWAWQMEKLECEMRADWVEVCYHNLVVIGVEQDGEERAILPTSQGVFLEEEGGFSNLCWYFESAPTSVIFNVISPFHGPSVAQKIHFSNGARTVFE